MDNRIDEAKILVERIVQSCKPEKIILFGSVGRGENRRNADIDLLIIKKSKKKRPFRVKEIFEAIRGIKREFPLDLIVYTPTEIEQRLSIGDYFIKNVINEGKILYAQE